MAYIEPKIRPVCDALNALHGVRTLWSCEGHAMRKSRPYVVFEAPEEFALQVQRMLHNANAHGSLHYWWRQTANFQENGRLQWLIEAPSIPNWHYWPIVRRKIDAELIALASMIRVFGRFQRAGDSSAPVSINSISGMASRVE